MARSAVAEMSAWPVFCPSAADILSAIDCSERWLVSFWDAMILVAARKAGATVVWSEDLNHEQTYDGVTVRNPFLDG